MKYRKFHFQSGISSILITVVILVVATIMVTFANRSIIYDLRSSGNEARYKEAFAIAEAGLNFAAERFSTNFRATYNGSTAATKASTLTTILSNSQVASKTKSDGTTASANEAGFVVSITDSGVTSSSGINIYTISATGTIADGTGTAVVQRQVTMVNALGGSSPDVPVVVGGAVGTGGNFNIVANPNGGNTPGAPVSVWSNSTVAVSSSSATCHAQFYSNGQCSNPSGNSENISRGTNPSTDLSTYTSAYPDILPNSAQFPSDLFNFVLGVARANWAVKKAQVPPSQVVSSCAPVLAAGVDAGVSYPIWWVTGDCNLSGGTIGKSGYPVVVVVDDGQFKSTGNTQINGIIYLFDNPNTAATPSAQLGGTVEIVGAFVSDVGGNAMSGSYSVVYDPTMVSSLQNNGGSFRFSVVPNSWRDFQ